MCGFVWGLCYAHQCISSVLLEGSINCAFIARFQPYICNFLTPSIRTARVLQCGTVVNIGENNSLENVLSHVLSVLLVHNRHG